MNNHEKFNTEKKWYAIFGALMEDDSNAASSCASDLITNKVNKLLKQPINEFTDGAKNTVKFKSNDVFINDKKVATLGDHDGGIVLHFEDGKTEKFETHKAMVEYIHDKFDLKKVTESEEQKLVIHGLRKLGSALNVSRPRYSSLPGISNSIQFSSKDGELPRKLRQDVMLKVLNILPNGFGGSNDRDDNVQPNSITLTARQWKRLLSYYRIEVAEPMSESDDMLTEGAIMDGLARFGEFIKKALKYSKDGKNVRPKQEVIDEYKQIINNGRGYAKKKGNRRAFDNYDRMFNAFDKFASSGFNPATLDELYDVYNQVQQGVNKGGNANADRSVHANRSRPEQGVNANRSRPEQGGSAKRGRPEQGGSIGRGQPSYGKANRMGSFQ